MWTKRVDEETIIVKYTEDFIFEGVKVTPVEMALTVDRHLADNVIYNTIEALKEYYNISNVRAFNIGVEAEYEDGISAFDPDFQDEIKSIYFVFILGVMHADRIDAVEDTLADIFEGEITMDEVNFNYRLERPEVIRTPDVQKSGKRPRRHAVTTDTSVQTKSSKTSEPSTNTVDYNISEDDMEYVEEDFDEDYEEVDYQSLIYLFRDLEHIITLSHSLERMGVKTSRLFHYDNRYYLVLDQLDSESELFETLMHVLNEYGVESNRTDIYLNEYGKTIFNENAIEQVTKYFKLY